jgi:ubiquinone/menaquinone biosynthesis C-methylase UbiE
MREHMHLPEYYRSTYASWYRWFSKVYDPFVSLLLFLLNGGFGGERRLRGLVLDWLAPAPGERILDICSGTGTLTIMIAERLGGHGEVIGVEISEHQLAVAERKRAPAIVRFLKEDAGSMPFPGGHFDGGVIFGALHEMPRDVRMRVMAEAFRVIKQGGRLVVLEHNRPEAGWRAWLYRELERPTPEYATFMDLLRCGPANEVSRAGFRVQRTRPAASEFFQVILAEKPGPPAT